jgi:alkylation response protein AidB-like acyl-CoA dehydrogenase
MEQSMTASQRRWVDLAAHHADDFATRAAQHDRENSFPCENFEALKASGYTSMPIPEELGGGGASLLDICYAQERLARGDGPTALAINMHLALPWVMSDLYRAGDTSVAPLLERIAKERLIVFAAIPSTSTASRGDGLGVYDRAAPRRLAASASMVGSLWHQQSRGGPLGVDRDL